MMRKKNIVLNGKKATGSELLKAGDALKIFFSEETLEKFSAEPAETKHVLDRRLIVYEDEQMIAVNKPAGMLSQKAVPSMYR